ncbi:MAG: hypothetical protein RL238_889 [Actinomycetota bacterium]|jgi:hypothetical protein
MSSEVSAMTFPVHTARATRSNTVDVAILMAAAAGLAHAFSTPTHWRWWQASGVFFALIAVAQLGLAAALFLNRTSTKVVLAGIWSNVVVVTVYVASRLVALPGQPGQTAHGAPKAPGRSFLPAAPEGVGAFDMFSLLVELGLIVLLLTLLQGRTRTRVTSALMYCGIGFCAFAVWSLMSGGAIR